VAKVTFSVTVLVCLALAACGGGGEDAGRALKPNTFGGDGVSFAYPGDWREVEYIDQPDDQIPVAVAIAPAGSEHELDSLSVTVAPDQLAVTEDNLDAHLDGLAEYATNVYGKLVAGPTPITVDGLPAISLEASGPGGEVEQLEFRTTIVFDGTTWYVIQVESIPRSAEEMKQGYDQVVRSFEVE
jgi:hypothetical protein